MRGIFNSSMKTAASVLTRMKPLSLYHPALYWLRVWQKRLFRQLAWRFSRKQYAVSLNAASRLPLRYLKHTSKLIPDQGWVLPFGFRGGDFYNYVDFVLHNPADRCFQLKLNLGE